MAIAPISPHANFVVSDVLDRWCSVLVVDGFMAVTSVGTSLTVNLSGLMDYWAFRVSLCALQEATYGEFH